MKFFAFAFLITTAAASSVPPPDNDVTSVKGNDNLIDDVIIDAIKKAEIAIRAAGLDPLQVKHLKVQSKIPLILEASAFVDNLELGGLSHVAINNVDYNVINEHLVYDFALPEVHLSIGDAGANLKLFILNENAEVKGSVSLKNARVAGEANVRLLPEVHVDSLSIDFSVGIQSDLKVNILNYDLSVPVNYLLNEVIPKFLAFNRGVINSVLAMVIKDIINSISLL